MFFKTLSLKRYTVLSKQKKQSAEELSSALCFFYIKDYDILTI